MPKVEIVDTFPAFLAYWENARDEPIDAQIETWAVDYMSQWPELLHKQVQDYAEQGLDWRQVARERVFPFLAARLPAMQTARRNLLPVCEPMCAAAWEKLEFAGDLVVAIYVGVGCGAGWATTYQQTPALLLGLENIAEEGWVDSETLAGLVAHELGHLIHYQWRAEGGQAIGVGPWWRLYEEGFAQRCEHVILGADGWHMAFDDDWLTWCRESEGWLAAEFLRRVDAGEDVRLFFGSWFDIQGRKQCGYFLGHEIVKRLETSMSMKEIALLDSQDARLRRELYFQRS